MAPRKSLDINLNDRHFNNAMFDVHRGIWYMSTLKVPSLTPSGNQRRACFILFQSFGIPHNLQHAQNHTIHLPPTLIARSLLARLSNRSVSAVCAL
jgi:hypothetical protein